MTYHGPRNSSQLRHGPSGIQIFQNPFFEYSGSFSNGHLHSIPIPTPTSTPTADTPTPTPPTAPPTPTRTRCTLFLGGSDSYIQGPFENGEIIDSSGTGVRVYPDGSYYKGPLMYGERHGSNGILVRKSSSNREQTERNQTEQTEQYDIFRGNWNLGQLNGDRCSVELRSHRRVSVYEGSMRNHKFDGIGELREQFLGGEGGEEDTELVVRAGNWKCGVLEGQATERKRRRKRKSEEENEGEGEFEQDQDDSDSDHFDSEFVGMFVGGKRCGRGSFVDRIQGISYFGEWKDNIPCEFDCLTTTTTTITNERLCLVLSQQERPGSSGTVGTVGSRDGASSSSVESDDPGGEIRSLEGARKVQVSNVKCGSVLKLICEIARVEIQKIEPNRSREKHEGERRPSSRQRSARHSRQHQQAEPKLTTVKIRRCSGERGRRIRCVIRKVGEVARRRRVDQMWEVENDAIEEAVEFSLGVVRQNLAKVASAKEDPPAVEEPGPKKGRRRGTSTSSVVVIDPEDDSVTVDDLWSGRVGSAVNFDDLEEPFFPAAAIEIQLPSSTGVFEVIAQNVSSIPYPGRVKFHPCSFVVNLKK